MQNFKNQVLQLFYQDMHNVYMDNYSWERFSFDGVDRSGIFETGKHVLWMTWFMTKCDAIFEAFNRLADQESKKIFVDLIRYKLSGHLHVKLNSRPAQLVQMAADFQAEFVGEPSTLQAAGAFGALIRYDQSWKNVHYTVDTIKNSLKYPLVYRQYFFERNAIRIQPELGDHVIDGGSFTGDTAIVFSRAVGRTGRVYSFDPVQNHLDICKVNFSRPGYENITAFGCGVSDQTTQAPSVKLGEYHPGWQVSGSQVPLTRIDDLVIDGSVERVDFIKLDVEGSEMAAIRGAMSSIHKYRPKLAISIYHKPDDFFDVCNLIQEQSLGYKFYVEHYTTWDEETVLYAAVD